MLGAAVRLRGRREQDGGISGQAIVVPGPGVDLIDFDLRQPSSEAAKALWAMVGLALALPRLIERENSPQTSPTAR